MFKPVDSLFKPRSIAIIGASETGSNGWPKVLYENLRGNAAGTKLYLVNPNRTELWGEKVYPKVSEIPETIDLGLVLIPAAHIPATLTDAANAGMRNAIISASQFGEGGDAAGLARAEELKDICRATGLRITGPNCTGALALAYGLALYPHTAARNIPAGSLGVVFQSAGAFLEWVQQAGRRGLGISYAVCSGNELDLDLADYLNFLIDDPATRTIACFIEGIRRPAAFLAAAERALKVGKPILVLKVGRSAAAQDAAKSHTGALTGDDAVFDAMCAKFGVMRCHALDDLIETSLVFEHGRLPMGNRIGAALTSGGARGLFLDHSAEIGVAFGALSQTTCDVLAPVIDPGMAPMNPLDAGAGVTPAIQPDKYRKVALAMAADPAVDVMVVQGTLPADANGRVPASLYAEIAASVAKPVIAFARTGYNVTDAGRAFQKDAGIPFLQGMPETLRAVKLLGDYARIRRRGIQAIGAPAAREADLNAATLSRHGLTPPRSVLIPMVEAVAESAQAFGFPLALKIVSPDAIHKTEIGGVAVNLCSAAETDSAARGMIERLRAGNPTARIDGFLLQEMVDGLELLLGVREDPQYGPLMAVGLGGVMVEVMQDIAVRLLPITDDIAREMLNSLRGRKALHTFRGRSARDLDAVVRAMVGVSALYAEQRGWIADLEVNPLIALAEGQGVRAVDVRVIRR